MKTPKSATKLKLTTPKNPTAGEKGAKKAATTGKSSKGKSKKKAEASDEEVETPKEAEKPVDPQEAKAKREKESAYHPVSSSYQSLDINACFQFYIFDTNCRRAFLRVTRHQRSPRWS